MKKIKAISDPELRVEKVACDDLMVIIRPVKNELGCVISYDTQTIQTSDFCASIMAKTLEMLSQVLPKTDPADGKTLWIKDGCLAFASGNPNDLGMQAQTAFDRNFKITLSELSTSDPGDGSPWLCGGVLMLGKNNTTKGCK